MRALPVIALLLAAGCFNPSPPAGSYLCSAVDDACPSGQSCECGLCVNDKTEAACAFRIDTAASGGTLTVAEHQPFSITVNALTANGTAASGFSGEVTLTSSWGDVRPNKVKLTNGSATLDVRLNRETLPPQTAKLQATFHGNLGGSGKIGVTAPVFTRQLSPVVPPAGPLNAFGWANRLVAEPNVIKDTTGYKMYFVGVSTKDDTRSGIGLATSPDAKIWTPSNEPLIINTGAGGFSNDISSPSVFMVDGKYHAVVSKGGTAGREVALGQSPDGVTWSIYNGGAAVLKPTDCGYCNTAIDFPQVVPDPLSIDAVTGKATSWILFFNATAKNGLNLNTVSIGRAQSTDGLTFVPEPAPLLSGDLTGEAILYSPRILVDGTVFKMWYSFARVGEISILFDLCDNTTRGQIGYATSDDGFYWIRSPSNPVLTPSEAGWDAGDRASLVSSVIPSDGSDPQNGIDIYYTTFRRTALTCLPNGIGKATRQ